MNDQRSQVGPDLRAGGSALSLFVKELRDLLPRHRRKVGQKIVNRVSCFEVIREVLHRHACTSEARRSAEDVTIDKHDRGFHAHKVRPIVTRFNRIVSWLLTPGSRLLRCHV